VKPVTPFVLSALLGLSACGGKDKKVNNPGGSNGSVTSGGSLGGQDPANMDPIEGLDDIPKADPNAGNVPGANPGVEPEVDIGPGVKPPTLDMPQSEKDQKVNGHLGVGVSALGQATPDANTAVREAELALQIDESSVPAMVLLAHANYVKGYYDLSEDILKKALKRGGTSNKQAYFILGLIYERTEREDKAPLLYQNALTLDPNYKSALINLGVHHLRNKRYADAIAIYERLTGSLGVSSAAAWNNLASGYRGLSADFRATDMNRRNQLVLKAEETYRRSISANKNYAQAYYNMGLLYLDADPFPQATGEMDRLQRLKTAKNYLDEYRRLPGADLKLVDETAGVAQKLIDKEELLRKKQAEREAKRKAREAARKKNADLDSDEGFE
jgi:tetratricopeptide (TPR) repeat protein